MMMFCISMSPDSVGFDSFSHLAIVGSDNPFGFSIDVVKDRVRMTMIVEVFVVISVLEIKVQGAGIEAKN